MSIDWKIKMLVTVWQEDNIFSIAEIESISPKRKDIKVKGIKNTFDKTFGVCKTSYSYLNSFCIKPTKNEDYEIWERQKALKKIIHFKYWEKLTTKQLSDISFIIGPLDKYNKNK